RVGQRSRQVDRSQRRRGGVPAAPSPPLFPYTTLFRSALWLERRAQRELRAQNRELREEIERLRRVRATARSPLATHDFALAVRRSEEHTSELQSRFDIVCRLLLEKKKFGEIRDRAAER